MYIDYDYYANCYEGSAVDAESFRALASRSCNVIDMITGYKIHGIGFENLSDFQQEQVKLACAAQLEYSQENGGLGYIATLGKSSTTKIGSFSSSESGGGSAVSPEVQAHLSLTGLLYMGVNICR